MERASHSPSPPFVLRPREAKGKEGRVKPAYRERTRNAIRWRSEREEGECSREKEKKREDARGAKIRMSVGMPLVVMVCTR